jgi:hypothetical protein
MKAILAAALLAAALVVPFTGDLVQSKTGIAWQFDGGQPGDAGGTCGDATRVVGVGTSTSGLLLPVDDEVDFYSVPVGAEVVNTTINITLVGHTAQLQAVLTVFTPGCAQDLADLQHQHCKTGDHESAKGEEHENSRDHDDKPTCIVRDVRVGDHWVSFVPLVPNTFVVRARLHLSLGLDLPLPLEGQPQLALPTGPSVQACQPLCDQINDALGYAVGAGSGPQ